MPENYKFDNSLLSPSEMKGTTQVNVVKRLSIAGECACDRAQSVVTGEALARLSDCRNQTRMKKEVTDEAGQDLLEFAKKQGKVDETDLKAKIKVALEKPAKADSEVLALMDKIPITSMGHILSNDLGEKADGIGVITALAKFVNSFNSIKNAKIRQTFVNFYGSILLARYSQALAATERAMFIEGEISGVKHASKIFHALKSINGLIDKMRPKESLDSRLATYGEAKGTESVVALRSATLACRGICEYSVKGLKGELGTAFACKRYDEMLDELWGELGRDVAFAYARQKDIAVTPFTIKKAVSPQTAKVIKDIRRIFSHTKKVLPGTDSYKYLSVLADVRTSDMHIVMSHGKFGTPIVALHRVMHEAWQLDAATYPARDFVLHVYLVALLGRYRKLLAEMHKVFTLADVGSLDGTTKATGSKLVVALDLIDAELKNLETKRADELVTNLNKAAEMGSGKGKATASA